MRNDRYRGMTPAQIDMSNWDPTWVCGRLPRWFNFKTWPYVKQRPEYARHRYLRQTPIMVLSSNTICPEFEGLFHPFQYGSRNDPDALERGRSLVTVTHGNRDIQADNFAREFGLILLNERGASGPWDPGTRLYEFVPIAS